jgi:hypothetical protein
MYSTTKNLNNYVTNILWQEIVIATTEIKIVAVVLLYCNSNFYRCNSPFFYCNEFQNITTIVYCGDILLLNTTKNKIVVTE